MHETYRRQIGQRIKKCRNELGLTQETMSELVGLTKGYYAQLEIGTSQMSLDTLMALAESFHTTTDYLLYGDKPEECDPDPVINLLHRCSKRELRIAELILKLFILKR